MIKIKIKVLGKKIKVAKDEGFRLIKNALYCRCMFGGWKVDQKLDGVLLRAVETVVQDQDICTGD